MPNKVFVVESAVHSSAVITEGNSYKSLIFESGNSLIRNHRFNREGIDSPLGQMQVSNQELKDKFGFSSKKKHSRTLLLMLNAISDITSKHYFKDLPIKNMPLYSGNTVGGIDYTAKVYENYLTSGALTPLYLLNQHDNGYSAEFAADFFGLHTLPCTVNTACSSAANAILLAGEAIQKGQTHFAIAGGVDPLSLFTIKGFQTLMLVDDDENKPLDKNRKGLNLGEASAFFLLASEKAVEKYNLDPKAVLSGWGNANDAYHATASSPDGTGALLAMRKALNKANLQTEDIQYINAHGTGTQNNDASEIMAITQLFSNDIFISSTKGHTGHTLGASGALEMGFCMQAILEQQLPVNANLQTPIQENLNIVTKPQKAKITHCLSNSFGFGGNCTSLIISAL